MLNAVIDISHHNGSRLDFEKARKAGVIGVIQKATQGEGYVDPTFKTNRARVKSAGLLFGAYHFGTGANGVSQAQHFLDVIGDLNETLLVLDYEDNPTGSSMPLEEARAFVTHLQRSTGAWPAFYSGHTIKRALGTTVDPILGNCPFWLAQYGPTPVCPPTWPNWTMWQYTDGGVGPKPHDVAGIGACDRNFFNGSELELRHWWMNNEVERKVA
ncbi:glycoside hydrolase family 25 protein [Rhizobium ruizarguesonis]